MSDTAYLEYYRDKTILVTGGAGAIGSNLVRALGSLAKRVLVLDDLSSSFRWNVPSFPNVMFVEGSILDDIKLKRVFFERPAVVFHMAAFFANQNSVDHPESDLAVNGQGTLKLLEYSTIQGVERFVYGSSGSSIYGSAPLPVTEDFMSMHLTTPYQATKMLGEIYCNFFHHHYGLPTVNTRFFNSYGPGEVPGQYRNVIPNFVYWAMKGLPLPITGTGEETRDFTFIDDTTDGLLRSGFFQAAVGESFNLAGGRETKIIDLANAINKATGNTAGVKLVPARTWDTKKRMWASVEKARGLIGYEPSTTLEQGLPFAVKWVQENMERIEATEPFGPGMSSAVREMTVHESKS